jgi:hypothetical protein
LPHRQGAIRSSPATATLTTPVAHRPPTLRYNSDSLLLPSPRVSVRTPNSSVFAEN